RQLQTGKEDTQTLVTSWVKGRGTENKMKVMLCSEAETSTKQQSRIMDSSQPFDHDASRARPLHTRPRWPVVNTLNTYACLKEHAVSCHVFVNHVSCLIREARTCKCNTNGVFGYGKAIEFMGIKDHRASRVSDSNETIAYSLKEIWARSSRLQNMDKTAKHHRYGVKAAVRTLMNPAVP
ncbi:unnamed protein product, partial [Ectocarpus sp. 12 AP-2014]